MITRRIELCLIHASVETNVATEVEFFVHIVEILADFLPRGIELAEFPVPPEVITRKLVHGAGRIDTSPRVTIPVPHAARTVPGLKHLNGHAHTAEAVKEIETSKASAHQDNVESFDLIVASRFCFGHAHIVPIPSTTRVRLRRARAFSPPRGGLTSAQRVTTILPNWPLFSR